MLDFTQVNSYQLPMDTFAAALTVTDLRRLTNESVDRLVALVEQCHDADIVHTPHDPAAFDAYAAHFRPEEAALGWSIGHNIVHATASAEEYAFNAAELARGVPYHGRSRYETPWQSITTVAQCLARLAESRRMRLATLDMWPDAPDLTMASPRGANRGGSMQLGCSPGAWPTMRATGGKFRRPRSGAAKE